MHPRHPAARKALRTRPRQRAAGSPATRKARQHRRVPREQWRNLAAPQARQARQARQRRSPPFPVRRSKPGNRVMPKARWRRPVLRQRLLSREFSRPCRGSRGRGHPEAPRRRPRLFAGGIKRGRGSSAVPGSAAGRRRRARRKPLRCKALRRRKAVQKPPRRKALRRGKAEQNLLRRKALRRCRTEPLRSRALRQRRVERKLLPRKGLLLHRAEPRRHKVLRPRRVGGKLLRHKVFRQGTAGRNLLRHKVLRRGSVGHKPFRRRVLRGRALRSKLRLRMMRRRR